MCLDNLNVSSDHKDVKRWTAPVGTPPSIVENSFSSRIDSQWILRVGTFLLMLHFGVFSGSQILNIRTS
jgi:hypothetical protein